MSATSKTEEETKEQVIDDMEDIKNTSEMPKQEVKEDSGMDLTKLAALKAKSQAAKENKVPASIVKQKDRSLRMGVVGTGQGGSKLAQEFYANGYPAVVLNTAIQDLKSIQVPDSNKLLLEYGVGGASKELSIGAAAAETHVDAIAELIHDKLAGTQVNILISSLGGGSGAGSLSTLLQVLQNEGTPIVVMAILPLITDDPKTKENSLVTLSTLATAAKEKRIANLILIDNAKLEVLLSDVSQFNFYSIANKSVVDTFCDFNELTSLSSEVKALDPMEYSKILLDGEGLSVYGKMTVSNYEESETALAEAIVENLENGLFASSFDLKSTKYVGFILKAPKKTWDKIPSSSVNYAKALLADIAGATSIFHGIYEGDESDPDEVLIYSIFSGLNLPTQRLEELKAEVKDLNEKLVAKDVKRNLDLSFDTGKNNTVSQAQSIKDKIANKNSTFGKFLTSSVTDKRKK